MFSASPISLTEAYTPSSSIRCHRHALASALTSVPSGCGFEVGAISLPSGATMRLRPPLRWKRIGIRTTSVVPSSRVSVGALGCCRRALSRRPGSCRYPLAFLPKLSDQACQALRPDPHLERVLMHLDPLDEELNDPRLFGGEQLAPDRGEVGEQKCDVALADLGAPLLGLCPGARNQLRGRQQLPDVISTAPSTSAAGTLVTAQLS